MSNWDAIRLLAREKHRAALEITGGDAAPEALLSAAAEMSAVPRFAVPAQDPLLYTKAHAALHAGFVIYNEEAKEWEQWFYQAHEYGHLWLDAADSFCCAPDLDHEATEDAIDLGAGKVESYGPHERRELAANVFAREFLLPGDKLRERFISGENAAEIAACHGFPIPMVIHQLTRAVLAPPLTPTNENSQLESAAFELDDEQREAAYNFGEPTLADAGPGTGKTRCLVERINRLIAQPDVNPSQILALTYSNKAAEEIYARVAAVAGNDASQIWIGTFHAFGLELIHKSYELLRLSPTPKIIDRVNAVLMLEQSLASLNLSHYRSLYDQSENLRSILDAISRAKDELVNPQRYAELAQAELAVARSDAARKKAERALEVAHVYERYQELLIENDYLDYGDLIFRAVDLLQDHPEVLLDLQTKFKHILVDEYQDVNTGSRLLLKLIAGAGVGLWVVGDLRQAIYRFRGAAPINLKLFPEDFSNAKTISLKGIYRSQRKIVRVFAACAREMTATQDAVRGAWRVKREENAGELRYIETADEKAEAAAIVAEVKRMRENGVSYRDQAILCRAHTSLALISQALENTGVPVLYLGNFFERAEIRDLLSVVSLACEPDGYALYRVGKFGEYQVNFSDVTALTGNAYDQRKRFPVALRDFELVTISADGKKGLQKLGEHFADFDFGTSVWSVLVEYLFVKSDYLRDLLRDESPQTAQKLLAIYQFLLLAYALRDRFVNEKGDAKRHFLKYVRHLKISGEEKQLRKTPDWANSIDAVRMLTVHSAKGLEFNTVFIPNLAKDKFPLWQKPDDCPPPSGMIDDERLAWHSDEEESLFFVALSRARDNLVLSRARNYNGKAKDESRLMELIRSELPAFQKPEFAAVIEQTELSRIVSSNDAERRFFHAKDLDVYLECPLEYYYRFVLKISNRRSDSAYAQTHLCVHRVWQEIDAELTAGNSVEVDFVYHALEEAWQKLGPVGHAYEAIYKRDARAMILRTLDSLTQAAVRMLRPVWQVSLNNGDVLVRPDYMETALDARGNTLIKMQRLRIGQSPASGKHKKDDIYALYRKAVESEFPDARLSLQAMYMSTGETIEIPFIRNDYYISLQNYERAIDGILNQRFEPRPQDRHCPHCTNYFNCPIFELPFQTVDVN